jgi:mRNA interferase YafQ
MLIADETLPPRFHDHSLAGEWKDHRDCHIKPDLVLIYRKPNPQVLDLVRLGSHNELGL